MIINRLSVLLAERNVRANRLAVETGIAPSTLTRINNNRSSQIDYETLNSICNFFKITPNDFFDYSPFDFEVVLSTKEEIKASDELTIFIQVQKFNSYIGTFEFTGKYKNSEDYVPTEFASDGTPENFMEVEILEVVFPDELTSFVKFINNQPLLEDASLSLKMNTEIYKKVEEALKEFTKDYYNDEFNDFLTNYVSILEPNQVDKEIKSKVSEIESRLRTNIMPF
ncbi:Predicted transcriptional regulator [Lactococcus cremoris subsp. cremoris SK11]|jgi:putative transcriptional regulator|uniref:Predicted transcriptional regulator n=2 Tax=Lactococcus lactis subsp. cremoris TaxID=1359 RepID=Q032G2_LACLS|nr:MULTISPECIES: helix-turn-helix transcriptional regulator [Lactococcus]ABJ71910.1 Predicted transcriptional regulator [Lactococcus cremoris subsp. cremoris SK11]ARE22511.1 helix-turn-helix transcriptional regulator [Lactococcus cremoris]KSU07234.1 Phage protein [Lactococcus lactis subsp. lactis]KZK46070.1 Phage protein [Lactococcus cremoris]KZK53175.1 Phage protein [Lactococcus cremoris]